MAGDKRAEVKVQHDVEWPGNTAAPGPGDHVGETAAPIGFADQQQTSGFENPYAFSEALAHVGPVLDRSDAVDVVELLGLEGQGQRVAFHKFDPGTHLGGRCPLAGPTDELGRQIETDDVYVGALADELDGVLAATATDVQDPVTVADPFDEARMKIMLEDPEHGRGDEMVVER